MANPIDAKYDFFPRDELFRIAKNLEFQSPLTSVSESTKRALFESPLRVASEQATRAAEIAAQREQQEAVLDIEREQVASLNRYREKELKATKRQQTIEGIAGIVNLGMNVYFGRKTLNVLNKWLSSIKYKENVSEITDMDTERIYNLRPVKFNYKGNNELQYGLIAEEVAEIMPEIVVFNDKGEPDAIDYMKLIAILLYELQKVRNMEVI